MVRTDASAAWREQPGEVSIYPSLSLYTSSTSLATCIGPAASRPGVASHSLHQAVPLSNTVRWRDAVAPRCHSEGCNWRGSDWRDSDRSGSELKVAFIGRKTGAGAGWTRIGLAAAQILSVADGTGTPSNYGSSSSPNMFHHRCCVVIELDTASAKILVRNY